MKYFIVKKLDDADSEKVSGILRRIKLVGGAVGWEEVEEVENAQILIAIGGDGTMLYAMSISRPHQIPVIGFNIGKIGFLAEFPPELVEETIIGIVNGLFSLDTRSMLFETKSKQRAMNEFVISPALAKDTLKYEFFVDGVSSGKHHANGLIISTPTGSTAYSLSVGGAIIQPNAPVFQIVPIAPMSLNSRSVIVGNESQIRVIIRLRESVKYNLVADGQLVQEFDSFFPGDEHTPPGHDRYYQLEFRRTVDNVVLMHGADWNFFDVLQQKLHWNTEI